MQYANITVTGAATGSIDVELEPSGSTRSAIKVYSIHGAIGGGDLDVSFKSAVSGTVHAGPFDFQDGKVFDWQSGRSPIIVGSNDEGLEVSGSGTGTGQFLIAYRNTFQP